MESRLSVATNGQRRLFDSEIVPTSRRVLAYACDLEECDFLTRYEEKLGPHMETHKNDANEGAGAGAAGGGGSRMALKHSYQRTFSCKEVGCNFSAHGSGILKRHHVQRHSSERPYICKENGCPFTATTSFDLTMHTRRRHSFTRLGAGGGGGGGGGGGASSSSATMATSAVMTQPRPISSKKRARTYVCKEEGCDYATTESITLKKHFRAMHTGSGAGIVSALLSSSSSKKRAKSTTTTTGSTKSTVAVAVTTSVSATSTVTATVIGKKRRKQPVSQ
jgi:hypothetical protein